MEAEKQALGLGRFLDSLPGGDEAPLGLTPELPTDPSHHPHSSRWPHLESFPPESLTSNSGRHQFSALPFPPEVEEVRPQLVEYQHSPAPPGTCPLVGISKTLEH